MRILDYQGEHLAYQSELLMQQRTFQAESTQFLHDYLQRMSLQSGSDMSGFPTMPTFPPMPDAPVYVGTEDDEDDDEDED